MRDAQRLEREDEQSRLRTRPPSDTERLRLRAALQALRERTEQARRLASELALAEQQERRRISELLHDHVQQMLYGIQLKLKVMSISPTEEIGRRVDEVQQLISGAIDTVRSMSVELSPPILGGEGIDASLSWLATYMERTYGLKVTLEVEGRIGEVQPDMMALIVQLVRELLFNVVKHAGVERANLRVSTADASLCVTVQDEGNGFEAPEHAQLVAKDGGIGLQTVRERLQLFGGAMVLKSSPGQGTTISIRLPLQRDVA